MPGEWPGDMPGDRPPESTPERREERRKASPQAVTVKAEPSELLTSTLPTDTPCAPTKTAEGMSLGGMQPLLMDDLMAKGMWLREDALSRLTSPGMPDSSSSKKRVAGLSTSHEAAAEEREPRATVTLHLAEEDSVRVAAEGERVAVQAPYENSVATLREAAHEALSREMVTDLEAKKLPNGRETVATPGGGAQSEAASSSLRVVVMKSVADDQHIWWPT
jgi:hypothetical protein